MLHRRLQKVRWSYDESNEVEAKSDAKWKQVGDAALATYNLALAEAAFKRAKDLGSLLLIYSAIGSKDGLKYLSEQAQELSQFNIQFTCQLALGDLSGCIDTLVESGRSAEALLFSRTYKPSLTASVVEKLKGDLVKSGKERVAKTIASPDGNLDLFPGWTDYLEAERSRETQNGANGSVKEGIPLSSD